MGKRRGDDKKKKKKKDTWKIVEKPLASQPNQTV